MHVTLLFAQAGCLAWRELFDEGVHVQRHCTSFGRLSLLAITLYWPMKVCVWYVLVSLDELLAGVCLACDFFAPHSQFVDLSFFFMMGLRGGVDPQSSQKV